MDIVSLDEGLRVACMHVGTYFFLDFPFALRSEFWMRRRIEVDGGGLRGSGCCRILQLIMRVGLT